MSILIFQKNWLLPWPLFIHDGAKNEPLIMAALEEEMGQNMNEGVRYFKDVLFRDFRCLPCLEFAIIGS